MKKGHRVLGIAGAALVAVVFVFAAVNAGRWIVMQHEEGTIITGRANIPENVIKAGHVQTFYGRHSQAIFSPSLDLSF